MRAPTGILLLTSIAFAQQGDRGGEEQPPLPADLAIPPAPALSAADELATLRLPAGLSVELVASEPLVRDPVAFAFDERARLWVVEMSGYMPDVDGRGEREPRGAIAVLTDEDGDGRMDRRSVFIDGLVLPRAVAPCRGGALVLAPPTLLFLRDTDGDGRADERMVVDRGLGGIESPEHAINGLLPTLDNALACSNVRWRYVWSGDTLRREPTGGAGQWGIAQDDEGRLFFNGNSDPLRADLIPSLYAGRNSNLGLARGANVRVVDDMSVRPARMTPGVNRGYQKDFLDAGFRLRDVTAACAPWIQRGTALGGEYRGDAFVCEPAANLVLRYRLTEDERGTLRGAPVRHGDPPLDFLTSTDERFRPVFVRDGPDGALYVADMYRGVIQHRLFVTTFLRRQVEARGLDRPIGMGRIWRIGTAGTKRETPRDLAQLRWTELTAALASEDGWTRDTAQRLCVEDGAGDADALELLRETLAHSPRPIARLHALWALAGLNAIDEPLALAALADGDRRVRLAAVRASEGLAASGNARVRARWLDLARSGDPRLRVQVLLSLGEIHDAPAITGLLALLAEDASTEELRTAALSGLGGRELDFLADLLRSHAWSEDAPGRSEFLELTARCIVREGRLQRIELLLELAALARDWQSAAVFAGVIAARPTDAKGDPGYVCIGREPTALLARLERPRAAEVEALLAWPGKPGVREVVVRPLDGRESERFARGRDLYASVCAACHLPSGTGDIGLAPPLRQSPFVLGDPERLARIVVHGLVGELELDGERWDGEMPAFAASADDLAAILTYVRREWGHGADPVEPELAKRILALDRRRPWTTAELGR